MMVATTAVSQLERGSRKLTSAHNERPRGKARRCTLKPCCMTETLRPRNEKTRAELRNTTQMRSSWVD